MNTLFLLLLLTPFTWAQTLSPVSADYAFQAAPEYQAILAVVKSYGEFEPKDNTRDVAPAPKEMSKGEKAVEEAKARNRTILEDMRKKETNAPKREDSLEGWKKQVKATQDSWKKEIEDTRRQWKKEQDIFLGKIQVYKEATFEIPVKQEPITEKPVQREVLPEAMVVNGAFNIPVRDQLGRATCSSFSGIRAIEILLGQNNRQLDLSEHYFYWSSKDNCQKAPCSTRGSWVTPGFNYSKRQTTHDIPLETACEYKTEVNPVNETQVPLKLSCRPGEVKVMDFLDVRTLADVIDLLKKNIPVVLAAKLTENFYNNKGLVTMGESQSTGAKLDGHAMGHAFLAVGMMELPKNLSHTEGNYCIIVANSWGVGWGAGGYSCITQKWLEKNRQQSPFAAVTRIAVKN